MNLRRLPSAKRDFDPTRSYVRFHALKENGFVDFEFAIGEPELSVCLTMHLADYRSFCRENRVTFLARDWDEGVDPLSQK